MGHKYEVANVSSGVHTFGDLLVQPRTRRVLELDEKLSDEQIERLQSSGIFVKDSKDEAQNDAPLPAADPDLVEAYVRLATNQGANREAVMAELGFGTPKPAAKTTSTKSNTSSSSTTDTSDAAKLAADAGVTTTKGV